MTNKLRIFRTQYKALGTFVVHPSEDVCDEIVGLTGYVDSIFSGNDEYGKYHERMYAVIFEGVNGYFLIPDESGEYTPDPPMTLQRKVQLLNEEDAYKVQLENE